MGTSGQIGIGNEDDCFSPTLIKNKQLQDKIVCRVSSGGQHTVILASGTKNNNKKTNSVDC